MPDDPNTSRPASRGDSDLESDADDEPLDDDTKGGRHPLAPPPGPLGPRLMDSAERKFGRFAIPHLIRYLAIFQVLTYVLSVTVPDYVIKLVFDRAAILDGEVWRILTCLVLPFGDVAPGLGTGNFLFVIVFAFFYIMISNGLESAWGSFRVNAFVFGSLLLMAAVILVFDPPIFYINSNGWWRPNYILFASAVMAFAAYFPNVQILFMFFLPLKIKWLGYLSGFTLAVALGKAWFITPALPNQWAAGFVVIAGVLPFFLALGPAFLRQQKLRAETAVRREKFQSRLPDPDEAFHSCAVCGATDQSHPEKEFRVAANGEEYCLEHRPAVPEAESEEP